MCLCLYVTASDYLKCPHALAWGTTNLIFSVLEFGSTYKAAGQYDVAMATIKWALDWLVKAHVKAGASPAANAFVGQVRQVVKLIRPSQPGLYQFKHAEQLMPAVPGCAVFGQTPLVPAQGHAVSPCRICTTSLQHILGSGSYCSS
jgi:hypothetical protein